jgi:hypothetical protein
VIVILFVRTTALSKLSSLFQTFLGQKYGYRPFPPVIPAEDFDKMLGVTEDQADLDLLQKWWLKDENGFPECNYLLQPITDLLPYYADVEKSDEKTEVGSSGYRICGKGGQNFILKFVNHIKFHNQSFYEVYPAHDGHIVDDTLKILAGVNNKIVDCVHFRHATAGGSILRGCS